MEDIEAEDLTNPETIDGLEEGASATLGGADVFVQRVNDATGTQVYPLTTGTQQSVQGRRTATGALVVTFGVRAATQAAADALATQVNGAQASIGASIVQATLNSPKVSAAAKSVLANAKGSVVAVVNVPSSSPAPTPSRQAIADTTGLTTPQKIGIGVGVGVGALGLIVLAITLVLIRKAALKREALRALTKGVAVTPAPEKGPIAV